MRPTEAFLSHSDKNRSFAVELSSVLTKHGIPHWYSRTRILGARQWHDEIGRALVRCDWFVVVLSPESVRSKWVKRELLFALNEDRYVDRIVPLVLEACEVRDLSWTLALFQAIDFTAGLHDGMRELLRLWGIGCDREA